jgi:hypothetical protein
MATLGDVSESLRQLLLAEMTDSTIGVTLVSPPDSRAPAKRANLFLYRVAYDPQLNSRDWVPKPGSTTAVRHPPLALNLHYLLTAYAPTNSPSGLAEAHRILGEAMRVFHEYAIVPQVHLSGGLRRGEVKVTPQPIDDEQLARIWSALQERLQLSAAYLVSYVELESTRERPIPRRVERVELEVLANRQRPAVLAMSPSSGPAGSSLVFTGERLGGWKPTVRFAGTTVLSDEPIAAMESFSAEVPADQDPGLYLVEVNVANLARFAASFEVTA